MAIRNIVDMMRGRKRDWFLNPIDEYFSSQIGVTTTVGYFRPSGLSQCAREMQYCYMGVAKYPNNMISNVKRMTRGTEHHNMWKRIFAASGIHTLDGEKYVVKCSSPLVEGTPDWAIIDPNGEVQLIDLKSYANAYSPIWEHVAQWSVYAYLLNDNYSMGISRGWILREDPVSLDLEPFPVRLEEEFIVGLLDSLRNIEVQTVRKKMVPRDCRCGHGNEWGQSCQIFKLCHSELGESLW
jgi:hypothetical protein